MSNDNFVYCHVRDESVCTCNRIVTSEQALLKHLDSLKTRIKGGLLII